MGRDLLMDKTDDVGYVPLMDKTDAVGHVPLMYKADPWVDIVGKLLDGC